MNTCSSYREKDMCFGCFKARNGCLCFKINTYLWIVHKIGLLTWDRTTCDRWSMNWDIEKGGWI